MYDPRYKFIRVYTQIGPVYVVQIKCALKGFTMTRTKLVEKQEGTDAIKKTYSCFEKKFGLVPNLYKVYAAWPEMFQVMKNQYHVLFETGRVDRLTKEMIAIFVSRINNCQYSNVWHTMFIRQAGDCEELISSIREDYKNAPISDKHKAVLTFSDRLTKIPYAVTDAEVDDLKHFGYSDVEILEITMVVSYCNAENREVLALGVDFEG